MAQIEFFAGLADPIKHLAGSGLGFYGASFGASVLVGEFQQTTFITDSNGTQLGPQVHNVKYLNSASGMVDSSTSGIALTAIPNYQGTLNIRFTHSSAVRTQNAELRIYDRSNINNPASGVTCYVAELIHPGITQINTGSGDTTWILAAGSATTVALVASPGMSGIRPNGAGTTADRHDWYTAISAKPDTIGSKTQFGAYVSLEYF